MIWEAPARLSLFLCYAVLTLLFCLGCDSCFFILSSFYSFYHISYEYSTFLSSFLFWLLWILSRFFHITTRMMNWPDGVYSFSHYQYPVDLFSYFSNFLVFFPGLEDILPQQKLSTLSFLSLSQKLSLCFFVI